LKQSGPLSSRGTWRNERDRPPPQSRLSQIIVQILFFEAARAKCLGGFLLS
jgi:hypothetical protein